MKHLILTTTATITLIATSCLSTGKSNGDACCAKPSIESVKVDSTSKFEQVSYTIGQNIASDIKKNGIDSLDLKFFNLAFADVFLNDTNRLTDAQIQKNVKYLTDSLKEIQMAEQLKQFLPNKTEGKIFFEKLKLNDSVKFTPSGLAYKITREGVGPKPKATDAVNAHYEGKLLNGKVFDSSYLRGQPTNFPLNRVIPGWTEGLQLIGTGGEIMLYIPYDLGYGVRGSMPKIEPYSALIFKVELFSIDDPHKGHNHGPGEHHH